MGVAEVPEHLRDLFLDAPYQAVGRVFDAAVAEDVGFLILSGDIVRPRESGPRGPLFLADQFARLAARGIVVYWIGGADDAPETWPSAVKLPQNVHCFPAGRTETIVFHRGAEPLARIVGVRGATPQWLRPGAVAEVTAPYTIAARQGPAEETALQAGAVDYWALGGRHDRVTLRSGAPTIHYCGSPQGRRPEEPGVHGCTLVQVDEHRQTRTSFLPTDSARWSNERVELDETTTRDELEMRLRTRMNALVESAPSVIWLVSWSLAGRGPLAAPLRRGKLAADLLQGLRAEFGYRDPAAWSVSLEPEAAETLPPEWYEQETIRGDYLRAVRLLQMNADEPLGLDRYAAESHRAGALAEAVALLDKTARSRALREAALLGADLLGGEDD